MRASRRSRSGLGYGPAALAAGLLLGALVLGVSATEARAQSIVFGGGQTTVNAGTLNEPAAVAVDAAGDVFIADSDNNRVVEVPAGGGAPVTIVTTPFVLSNPLGVAVDSSGNLFIADYNNSRVVKVPPAGGGSPTTVGNVSQPNALAVDGSGDLFIVQPVQGDVVEVTPSGSQTTIVGGLAYPSGVAVDGLGDLFIADTEAFAVIEVAPGGAQTTLVSGSELPGVAVDKLGDVFIVGYGPSPLLELPAGGGAPIALGVGIYGPLGLAVDGSGNVFVADTLNNRVVEVQPTAVNFGPANICPAAQSTPAPCSQSETLVYNGPAYGTVTVGTVNALTMGAPNLDFSVTGNTCTGAVTSGLQCTVNVTFAPIAAGLRRGALQLKDGYGNVLASTLIYGNGTGPQIAFGPGVQQTLASGLDFPSSVAVDGAGNVYLVNNGNLLEVPAGAGAPVTIPLPNVSSPIGVTVDGAGNLFVADLLGVVKVPAGGGVPTALGSGWIAPYAVAVDGAGNVFVADYRQTSIVEVPASGGPQIAVGSGLSGPSGVAVDAAGNLFIADTDNRRVVEVPAGGGAQQTLASNLVSPRGVALDGAGNLFVSVSSADAVIEIPAGGGAQTVAASYPDPSAVALDGSGNLFVTGTLTLVELQRSQAPALNFASTPVDTTSSDSPQSVTIQNIGNAPLAATGLTVGANFAQVPGSGTPADCTATFSLAPGVSCNLSISFTPTASGSLQSTAVLTDNALNGNPATQSIALSGTGVVLSQTITFNTIPTQRQGTNLTLSATASSNLPVTFTSETTTICTVSGNTASLISPGTCRIQASQPGDAEYMPAPQVTQAFTVQGTQTITFNAIPNQVQGTVLTLSATASSNLPVSFTSLTTGVCTVSGNMATLSNPGTCSIQASQPGNTLYLAAMPVTQSFTVLATQTITFNAIPTQTQGTNLTLSATASSSLPVSFASLTTTVCTVSGNTASLTGSGTCSIQASQAGNSTYAPASPVTQSFTVSAAANFTITPLPPSETVYCGVLAAFLLELQSEKGFNGNVTLSCSGGPAGAKCADLPQTLHLNGTALAVSGILFPAGTKAGTYTMTFTGVSGSLKNSTTAQFTVK